MKEYIEREALIKEGWLLQRTVYGNGNATIESKQLKDIPTADVVEVRHGRWEHNDDDYGCEDLWWCSACKEEFVLIEGTPRDNGYYYCPNCGAKMDGGVNDVNL